MLCRKRRLQKFRKFHRKTAVLESLFNKVADLGDSKQVFSCENLRNTYFEEHLRTTASEFIGDTTLLQETILKKYTDGKTSFQDSKEYNQKQQFE